MRNGWTRTELDEEITYEQFLKELDDFKAWLSRSPRRRAAWLYAMYRWAEGDH